MWVISKVGLDDDGRAQRFLWRRFTAQAQPVGDQAEVDRNEVVSALMRGETVTTVWPNAAGSITGGPNLRVRIDERGEEWAVLDTVPGDRRRVQDLPKL